jgi:kynurenine formamidase
MLLSFSLGDKYEFDSIKGIDISIPMDFYGNQPNAYGVEKALAQTYESDSFIGDTRKGGGCNFEKYTLVPHCNGTHTECVGHISFERIFINENLNDVLIPCTLITVSPIRALETEERYSPSKNKDDFMITKEALSKSLENLNNDFFSGLIIRTLPNADSKKSRDYMKELPAFFSLEAMEYISSLNVKHLLVDLPSVDRTADEGKLSVHHIFWNVTQGSHDVNVNNHSLNTITEMIYVPDEIEDGKYLLNLQIASFLADASPSRPILYKLKIKN